MNLLPPHSTIAPTSRALAIALTVFLFVVGSFPAAGQAFPGVTHWIAHLAAYAASVIDRSETLCGKRPQFIQGDIRGVALLLSIP